MKWIHTYHIYSVSVCLSVSQTINFRKTRNEQKWQKKAKCNHESQLSYYRQFAWLLHVTLPSPSQIVILPFVLVTLWDNDKTTTRTSEQRKWWKNKVLSFSTDICCCVACKWPVIFYSIYFFFFQLKELLAQKSAKAFCANNASVCIQWRRFHNKSNRNNDCRMETKSWNQRCFAYTHTLAM